MATKYMMLDLPKVGSTQGPTWASMLNAVLEKIDNHDHTSGSGRRIPLSSIFIDGSIDLLASGGTQSSGITNCAYVRFVDRSPSSGQPSARSLFSWKGDLWWNVGAAWSDNVQITQAGQLYSKTINFNSINVTQDSSTDYKMTYLENWVIMFITTVVGAGDMLLPPAALAGAGRFYIFQDLGTAATNNISIVPLPTETINKGSVGVGVSIVNNYGHYWLTSDGVTNWIVTSSN
jgi:hypothetical protein